MHRVMLHTFQRTGRNFISTAIHQLGGIWIDSSQSNTEIDYGQYDKVITIVRNPVDCIASLSLMAEKFNPEISYIDNVAASSSHWIKFHKNSNMVNSVFLNFKELEDDGESFIKKILSLVKIEQIKNYKDIDFDSLLYKYEKNHETGFTVTEKNNPNYAEVLEYTRGLDLSEHMKIYNDLIKRCI
jgi:hypothetical protein